MSDVVVFLEYLGYLLAILILLWVVISIIKCIISSVKKCELLRIVREKRTARDNAVKSLKVPAVNIPQDLYEEILNSDVTHLKTLLDQRRITSEQLLNIFTQRAITVGFEHELITETNYADALVQARECDNIRNTKYFNQPIKDKEGLLFGIPISIKDLFEMKGFDCNYGCGALCNNLSKEDGYVIKLLKSEGAILFVRSNIPQVAFAFESWNKVYGKAQNPWNRSRTTGGSSGGEAGLVAARCSPLGLGSDMGGSIRAPAGFCGVYGFKPSSRRISVEGDRHLTDAFFGLTTVIPVSFGPLAKSVDDVALMMKVFLNERFHFENRFTLGGDTFFKPTPWNDQVLFANKPYKIGYLRNNDFMPVAATYTRAIDETVEALRTYGHELVMVDKHFTFMDVMQSLYYQALTADADLGVFKDATKEQGLDAELFANLKMIINIPNCLKSCIKSLATCLNMPRVAALMKSTVPKNSHELLELISSIRKLRSRFMDWWVGYGLDALIIPNIGMPAFKHGLSGDISVFGVYTMLSNLLDLPAGAVPITLIAESETKYDELVASNNDMITKKAKENMLESEGMPAGVQVITPFLEEERCVAIMKQIEQKIRFHQKHGFPV